MVPLPGPGPRAVSEVSAFTSQQPAPDVPPLAPPTAPQSGVPPGARLSPLFTNSHSQRTPSHGSHRRHRARLQGPRHPRPRRPRAGLPRSLDTHTVRPPGNAGRHARKGAAARAHTAAPRRPAVPRTRGILLIEPAPRWGYAAVASRLGPLDSGPRRRPIGRLPDPQSDATRLTAVVRPGTRRRTPPLVSRRRPPEPSTAPPTRSLVARDRMLPPFRRPSSVAVA